jgi:O-antigen ligase
MASMSQSAAHHGSGDLFWRSSQFFLALFLLVFPLQIRLFVYGPSFYGSGNFNPYTTFFLYGADIFLAFAFFCWGLSLLFQKSKQPLKITCGDRRLTFLLLIFLLTLIPGLFWAQDQWLHLLFSLRFLEFFLLYLLIVEGVLSRQRIFFFMVVSLCFQATLAIFQFFFQSSVGLHFLGETVVTPTTLGVAKIDMPFGKILRAFGTFPHANVLGGAMVFGLIVISFLWNNHRNSKKRKWFFLALFLLSLGLLFSFSRSAFLAAGAAFLLVKNASGSIWKRFFLPGTVVAVGILIIFTLGPENPLFQRIFSDDPKSVSERLLYADISGQMIKAEPLGVGLGGFTQVMQNFTGQKLSPWLFQPVHNIFLLGFSELGVFGGLMFMVLFGYSWYVLLFKKAKDPLLLGLLTVITVIGLFDHYFFSLYPGQVLLFIVLALVSSILSHRCPHPLNNPMAI